MNNKQEIVLYKNIFLLILNKGWGHSNLEFYNFMSSEI